MQLGTRWPLGGDQPDRLPAVVRAAIRSVEAELDLESGGVDRDTSGWRWTLTWLEGRPVVELDDGTIIRYNSAEDTATTTNLYDAEE